MDLLARRTKATASTKILVHLRLSKLDHLVAVITDLKRPIRKILFDFKCKPLDNGIQKLMMFLRLLGVQKILQFSACVQVILNAIAICPNDPIVV